MNQSALPLRILASATFGSGPKRPSRHELHVVAPVKPTAKLDMRNIIEREVARIVDALPAHGESVQRAFDRKERELREVFLSLTRAESTALYSKLNATRDAEANLLARLTGERRNRVLAGLAEITRANGGAK